MVCGQVYGASSWLMTTMVGITAGQVVLSGIIKQAEKARGSKPVSSVPPPWSLSRPCLQVPKWVQALTSLHDGLQAVKNEVNPSLLRLLLAICTKERGNDTTAFVQVHYSQKFHRVQHNLYSSSLLLSLRWQSPWPFTHAVSNRNTREWP